MKSFKKGKRKKYRTTCIYLCLLCSGSVIYFAGCSSGPMDIRDRYYLGASNGNDRVYYRITINANTRMGDAEFRQGWFPSEAVDALFGDVSEDGSAEALTVREELRKQIDQKLIAARKAYLKLAVQPDAKPEDLEKRLLAVRNVRLAARDSLQDIGAVGEMMEYKPQANLVTYRAGQKLVLMLSSNPDQIITQLAKLAEDTDTEKLFNKFAQVIEGKEHIEDLREQATFEQSLQQSANVGTEIEEAVQFLGDDSKPVKNREKVLGRIDALISLLEAVE